MKIRTEYQERKLDEVMRYFAKDFQCKIPGEKIHHVEYFVDPVKQVVVFKLFVKEREEK